MCPDTESTPSRDARRPLADIAFGDLLDTTARLADEVVMVLDRAQPIPQLHRILPQNVDHAVIREHPERPVDGGEAGPAPGVAEPVVQLLGRERFAAAERREHLGALLGLPHAAALPRATFRRASRYASVIRNAATATITIVPLGALSSA